MICKQCNNNVPNDSEYCPFCGNIVEQETIQTNTISNVDKGYTYLELKEWKKAKEIFDFAIVNNDNKARAYIGRLLAQLKLADLDSLSDTSEKLTKFDDFKMAVKYADNNYKQQLKKCYFLVEERNNQKKVRTKKRLMISSISCMSLILLLSLTYFVFIPHGRYSYYEKLLSDGNIKKATQAFSNSKWFEFDEKAETLFYNHGVSLVENKDYKNAEFCFDISKDFKDSNNYYTYCKAQNLLAENDLESYNCFTKCKDFLDSKDILETNEYFILVNKLQGEWYYPGIGMTQDEYIKKMLESGEYYEKNGQFYCKDTNARIFGPAYSNGKRIIINGSDGLSIYNGGILYESQKVEFISDKRIRIHGIEFEKQ